MHLEEQTEAAPRRRRSYTKQYKAKLVAQCLQPHVSIASIALAHGLNANLLRRWVVEHNRMHQTCMKIHADVRLHAKKVDGKAGLYIMWCVRLTIN